MIDGKIHVVHLAKAKFYAPSDISDITGMCGELIHATSLWRAHAARYDCVLVNTGSDTSGIRGFEIAHVFLFFSFEYGATHYPCALIQWFSLVGSEPNKEMGLWTVNPEYMDTGDPHLAVIHIDSIYQAIHLIPVYQNAEHIDLSTMLHSSLDAFNTFYVNKFANHHSFKVLS